MRKQQQQQRWQRGAAAPPSSPSSPVKRAANGCDGGGSTGSDGGKGAVLGAINLPILDFDEAEAGEEVPVLLNAAWSKGANCPPVAEGDLGETALLTEEGEGLASMSAVESDNDDGDVAPERAGTIQNGEKGGLDIPKKADEGKGEGEPKDRKIKKKKKKRRKKKRNFPKEKTAGGGAEDEIGGQSSFPLPLHEGRQRSASIIARHTESDAHHAHRGDVLLALVEDDAAGHSQTCYPPSLSSSRVAPSQAGICLSGHGDDDTGSLLRVMGLPHNQYETMLRRRAIIKAEDDKMARDVAEAEGRKRCAGGGGGRSPWTEGGGSSSRGGGSSSSGGGGCGGLDPKKQGKKQLQPRQPQPALRQTVQEAQRQHLMGMPSPHPEPARRRREMEETRGGDAAARGRVPLPPLSLGDPALAAQRSSSKKLDGQRLIFQRHVQFAPMPEDEEIQTKVHGAESGDSEDAEEEKAEEVRDEGDDDNEDEVVGDVSLGMKLTILAGKVIVQGLNPLGDGRASPAQLTGMIQRGDVLLAIDDRSLVHLGIDELLEGLKPLSSAEPLPPPPRGIFRETSTTFGRIDFGAKSNMALSDHGGDDAAAPDRRPVFRRELRLRFAIGEGLPYLEKNQRRELTDAALPGAAGGAGAGITASVADGGVDADVGAALSLAQFVPMVDSLGGVPIFHDQNDKGQRKAGRHDAAASVADLTERGGGEGADAASDPAEVNREGAPGPAVAVPAALSASAKAALVMNQEIATYVAVQRRWDRIRYTSEFFSLDDRWPVLLRATSSGHLLSVLDPSSEPTRPRLSLAKYVTRHEVMERGRRGLVGAKVLFDRMEAEAVEESKRRACGSVVRNRRRSAENPASSSEDEDEDAFGSDVDSGAALGGGDLHDEDDEDSRDDRLLLRNAAYDDMWKERIIIMLQKAVLCGLDVNGSAGDTAQKKKRPAPALADSLTASVRDLVLGGDDDAVESELQSLFFGEGVSTMMRKKKSLALPPQDLTGILFDLASRIAITTSDRVNLSGKGGGRTTLSSRLNQQVVLATRFLLDDALSAWLATFRPLKWQQRRVLWPLSTDGAHQDHDMTISIASSSLSTGWGTPNTRKKLQEQIEEMELDVELRAETCYLVTFFFTRKILADFASILARRSSDNSSALRCLEESSSDFVRKYGAYLKLHTSLSFAADVRANALISVLLSMAKFDLRHREFVKALSKKTLILYEPAMLSALLVRLMEVGCGSSRAEHARLLPLLVSAYPDLQPWQVRMAAKGDEGNGAASSEEDACCNDFYYSYLSYLLDPEEGSDSARRDAELVKEWCKLSISEHRFVDCSGAIVDKLSNFRLVASKTSDAWMMYHRDLPVLMDLSMEIGDHDLASDLAVEIIAHPPYCDNTDDLSKVLGHLRFIAKSTILESDLTDRLSLDVLRRTILILNMMAMSKSEPARNSVDVSGELKMLLEGCARIQDKEVFPARTTEREKAFVALIAETAAPADVITTLAKWNRSNISSATVMPALRSSLTWGARVGVRKELSGALLRVRQARGYERRVLMKEAQDWQNLSGSRRKFFGAADGRVWQKLMNGDAAIEK